MDRRALRQSQPDRLITYQHNYARGLPPVFGSVAGFRVIQVFAVGVALVAGAFAPLLDDGMLQIAACVFFLLGGLPHGAFDIHLAARRADLGLSSLGLFTALYLGLFAVMIAGWYLVPALTLAVFLVTAIVHFSEDWCDVSEPLFRFALGFAPLCAIGMGHLTEVEMIFAAMTSDATARATINGFVLIAPITLLIAGTALFALGKDGKAPRALAFAIMLASLFVVPPLIGFALFFCAFHTPRHLVAIGRDLADWPISLILAIGASLTLLALLLGALLLPYAFDGSFLSVASAFQLLAALAMPHQSMDPCLKLLRRNTPANESRD